MLCLERPGLCGSYISSITSVWDSYCHLSLLGSLPEDVSGEAELEHVLGMEEADLSAGLGSCS